MLRRSLTILLLIALAACATQPPAPSPAQTTQGLPPVNDELVTGHIAVIEPEALFELSAEQQQTFFEYFNDPVNQQTAEHERVANYLSIIMDRFVYEEKTLTAEQTLLEMSGNCLSLANLTTAYARLAGVPIRYHFLENNPVFIFADDLLIRSDHIRSVLSGNWSGEESEAFQIRRDIRVDYFPTDGLQYVDDIPEALQYSMYYSNRAVELVAQQNYASAFAHAQKALAISNANASAYNTLGVLHRRMGDLAGAEAIYLHAAKQFPENPTFLRNLSLLLQQQERSEELAAVQKRISEIESRNPWQWLVAGRTEHQHGDFEQAINSYQKALEIAPHMHQVELYLAMAYVQSAQPKLAEKHLQSAIDLSNNQNTRMRYQRKLMALKKAP
ncbi:MAG: tetratricopeptide repeat protein [Pseudomonadota bacterium]